jgi:hypothetical protein
MNTNEMIAAIGRRMEDPSAVSYVSATVLEALNNAQLKVATLLPDEELTEIEAYTANVSVSSGAVAFSTIETAISKSILGERIQNVRINGGAFMDQLVSSDSWKTVNSNSYLTASSSYPYFWVNRDSIYVLPADTSAVDVWCLTAPTTLVVGTASCVLNVKFHQSVLDFAEAELWLTSNRGDRASIAEDRAIKYLGAFSKGAQ